LTLEGTEMKEKVKNRRRMMRKNRGRQKVTQNILTPIYMDLAGKLLN
jgi:hypothetical protein